MKTISQKNKNELLHDCNFSLFIIVLLNNHEKMLLKEIMQNKKNTKVLESILVAYYLNIS